MDYPVCLCGSHKYRRYEYRSADLNFAVLACRSCGLARTWPSPLEDTAADDFYNHQSGHEEKFDQLALRRAFSLVPLNVLREYCSSGRLLDVGSSVGIFVQVAREHGFDAQGIDLGEEAIRDGQKQLQLQEFLSVGTLATKRFPDDYFEAISYLHCFEHIPDLIAELDEIKRVLKPSGFLIIEVPRFFSLWRVLLGSRWYGFCPLERPNAWWL
jgi:SAM-dependent methyltransferase